MKTKKLPSWRAIAKGFHQAFKRCDFSYGRVQDAAIHDALNVVALDTEQKERREKRRRRA